MRLFKRGDTWYIEYRRGLKRSLRTRDKAVARARFNALKARALSEKLAILRPGSIALSQWRVRYLDGRRDMSAKTLLLDGVALRALEDVLGADRPLSSITSQDLEKFKSTGLARGLSPLSVNTYLRHILASLRAAARAGLLDRPPEARPARTPRKLPRVLGPEERARIQEMADRDRPELGRIIRFALWTGCRLSEILYLRWEHVNGTMAVIHGKGQRERVVPLLPAALDAMGPPKDIGPVFRHFHADTVSHYFKRVAVAAGCPDARFHDLRHTSATCMLESGIALPVIQAALGHASVTTTQIYAQVLAAHLHQEMQKLRL